MHRKCYQLAHWSYSHAHWEQCPYNRHQVPCLHSMPCIIVLSYPLVQISSLVEQSHSHFTGLTKSLAILQCLWKELGERKLLQQEMPEEGQVANYAWLVSGDSAGGRGVEECPCARREGTDCSIVTRSSWASLELHVEGLKWPLALPFKVPEGQQAGNQ